MDFSEFKRQMQSEGEEKPTFEQEQNKPDVYQNERHELQEQQIPQQNSEFDPEKFLKEKAGIIPAKPSSICPDCNNTGIVKEKDGVVHTCWTCLQNGRLDCHTENLPDNPDIRL